MVWCHHGIERRSELLTASGAPIAPHIELLEPICAQYRSSGSKLLLGPSICATEGTDRIKKLDMVIGEENQPSKIHTSQLVPIQPEARGTYLRTLRAREDPTCKFTSLADLLTADFLEECLCGS
jgi:hypothetical protein